MKGSGQHCSSMRHPSDAHQGRSAFVPILVSVTLLVTILAACVDSVEKTSFYLLTGSENRILFDDPDSDEPTLIEQFEKDANVDIIPSFQGSVDTMLDIQAGAEGYDAVWPASSVWMNLGNTDNVLTDIDSIMGTAVVFGIKRSKAEELGWIDTPVYVEDILQAAESGELKYMMSSATQSNSGAMAYLGYLYAFAGHPAVLQMEDLENPDVQDRTVRLLGEVDRTAGASGFLRDVFLADYDSYDGMVNNESAIITANQTLIERGETDLLQVIYPEDGLAFADWPLGYADRGDPGKQEIFEKLKTFLLSDEVQQQLVDQGRRPTQLGFDADYDPEVFDADWGVVVDREFPFINVPTADVTLAALNKYQEVFRKPAFTVLCLDYSESMTGAGERDLELAMSVMLNSEEAGEYLLQRGNRDVTIVKAFNTEILAEWQVKGNAPEDLESLLQEIRDQNPTGGTAIYHCLNSALRTLDRDLAEYAPAIILLTDGKNKEGSFDDFAQAFQQQTSIPVYSIMFGDASEAELQQIAAATQGAVYDGRDGLVDALRKSFGNVS